MEKTNAPRFLGLEGIRAYGIIIVFLFHYTKEFIDISSHHKMQSLVHLWTFFMEFAWMAVPVFFVLSGFLITGILYDTRDRAGFFKVFYGRRALRILPLYYLVIGVTAIMAVVTHARLHLRDLSYIIYLHNFFLHGREYDYGRYFSMTHLWSLAVEEQFYLLWPVVIWFVRKREWLLWTSYLVIAAVVLLRICWPLTRLPIEYAYYSTFARCDAIMLGAVLALHIRGERITLPMLVRPAQLVLFAGFVLFVIKIVVSGSAGPSDYWGVAALMPLVSVMSAALVVLALVPGNSLYRFCTLPWAVRLGSKSYSLYVLHFIALPYFTSYFPAYLRTTLGSLGAELVSMAIAAASTYLLSCLTFRYLEVPAMKMKSLLSYGPSQKRSIEPMTATMPVDGAQQSPISEDDKNILTRHEAGLSEALSQ